MGFTYISLTYIRFYLSGSARHSHFETEFEKNSKTYACTLTKNHLVGWLTSHMNTLSFLQEFLKKGEISHRWTSPPNRASSLPYEQPLSLLLLYSNLNKKTGIRFSSKKFLHKCLFKIPSWRKIDNAISYFSISSKKLKRQ